MVIQDFVRFLEHLKGLHNRAPIINVCAALERRIEELAELQACLGR